MKKKYPYKNTKNEKITSQQTGETPILMTTPTLWESIIIGIVFLGIFLLYLMTLAPNISVGDSAEFISSAYTLGIPHPPGYPLFNLIGKLFSFLPIGSIAWRINLSSAVFNLAAAYCIYLTVYKIVNSWQAALFAAMFFAVSPIIWEYSLKAEVFALNNFFAALILYLLMLGRHYYLLQAPEQSRRIFYSTLFICGLALTNHHTIILLAPAAIICFYYYHRQQLSEYQTVLIALLFFLLGLSIYLYLPIRAYAEPYLNWDDPKTFTNFIKLISRSDYGSLTLMTVQGETYDFTEKYAHYLQSIIDQFNYLGTMLFLLGMFYLIRKKEKKLCVILLVALSVSSTTLLILGNVPKFTPLLLGIFQRFYMLPTVVIALFIGIGISFLYLKIKDNKITRYGLNAIITVAIAYSIVYQFPNVTQRNNNLDYYYGLNVLYSAEKNALIIANGDINIFALNNVQLVSKVRPDVIILDHEKLSMPWYQKQIQKRFPKILIPTQFYSDNKSRVLDIINTNIAQRPIYLTNFTLLNENNQYRLAPWGLLQKVVGKNFSPNDETYIQYIKSNTELWKHYNLADLSNHYTETALEREIIQQYSALHFYLGWEYTQSQFIDLAIEEFIKAIDIDPTSSASYRELGTIYANIKHQPKLAINIWQKYIKLNPTDQQNDSFLQLIQQYQDLKVT